jgi:DNA mismatch repair ATPase MutS
VFLYRLIDGVANKSFGMNVAKKAGVPLDVVQQAETKAREFEAAVLEKSMDNSLSEIRQFRAMVQDLMES